MSHVRNDFYASQLWKDYVDETKRRAYGNWDSILSHLAPTLQPALEKFGKHVACPRHGGTDGFRFYNDGRLKGSAICNTCGRFADGFELLTWLYAWRFSQTLEAVAETLGIPHPLRARANGAPAAKVTPLPPPPQPSPEEVARKDAYYAKRLQEAWDESVELMHEAAAPARAYLKRRGITEAVGPLRMLRVHPGMEYFENNVKLGTFPTLLAMLLQPNGQPCTLHRIYLTADGEKAPVEAPKKIMPRRSTVQYMGSAVRLDENVGSVLLGAEGLETAMAVRALMGLPTWASTVAGLLEGMVVAPQVRVFVAFGDKDKPQEQHPEGRGYSAAAILCDRLRSEGRKATVYLPPFALSDEVKKLDWLDVLASYGLEQARKLPIIVNARKAIAAQLEALGLPWESANAHY